MGHSSEKYSSLHKSMNSSSVMLSTLRLQTVLLNSISGSGRGLHFRIVVVVAVVVTLDVASLSSDSDSSEHEHRHCPAFWRSPKHAAGLSSMRPAHHIPSEHF